MAYSIELLSSSFHTAAEASRHLLSALKSQKTSPNKAQTNRNKPTPNPLRTNLVASKATANPPN